MSAIREPRTGERGFTLVEVMVLVAILLVLGASAWETLAQRGAQARASAVAFAGLVAEARSLAAVTGEPTLGGGGASIGVVREGDAYVATLYAYRPVRGASHAPSRQPNTPPLRTATALALRSAAGGAAPPPFALFFSPSGHASAQPNFTVAVTPALADEPACQLETGIVIEFSDATQTTDHAISCELAQLDLNGSARSPSAPAAAAVRLP